MSDPNEDSTMRVMRALMQQLSKDTPANSQQHDQEAEDNKDQAAPGIAPSVASKPDEELLKEFLNSNTCDKILQ